MDEPESHIFVEGFGYTFKLTPYDDIRDKVTIRWEIVFNGDLPASASDFEATGGTRIFLPALTTDFEAPADPRITVKIDDGGTESFTITPRDDMRPESRGEFVLLLYQKVGDDGSENLLHTRNLVLEDNDAPAEPPPVPTIRGNADENTITLGSDGDAIYDGGAGDDSYVITRFLTGNATIADSGADDSDTIHFDDGVVITDLDAATEGRFVITFENGGTLTIENVGGFLYDYFIGFDLGIDFDSELFKGALGAAVRLGKREFNVLVEPEAAGSDALPLQNMVGDTAENILTAAGDADAKLLGGRGDDVYVISRFQKGDVRILDFTDDNLIKFDYGVEIIGFEETTMRAGAILSELTLTLEDASAAPDDKPQVVIRYPAKFFRYQMGDEAVIDYAEFREAHAALIEDEVSGTSSSDIL